MITNLGSLYLEIHLNTERGQNLRGIVLALANDPSLDSMDGRKAIDAPGALYLTVGVVQRMHRQGDLP